MFRCEILSFVSIEEKVQPGKHSEVMNACKTRAHDDCIGVALSSTGFGLCSFVSPINWETLFLKQKQLRIIDEPAAKLTSLVQHMVEVCS